MKWKVLIIVLLEVLMPIVRSESAGSGEGTETVMAVQHVPVKTEQPSNDENAMHLKTAVKSKRKLKTKPVVKQKKESLVGKDGPSQNEEDGNAGLKVVKAALATPERKLKKKKSKHFGFKIDQTTLKATSSKLKEERRKLKDSRKLKSAHFRSLLRRYYIRPDQLEHLAQSTDKRVKLTLRSLKQLVNDLDYHLWQPAKPKARKAMLQTRKRLEKQIKSQIKGYSKWHKLGWKRIEAVWKQKGFYYLHDEELNRSEHEKLYQLFIIENGEKLKYLLPMIDVERKIVESIHYRVADWDNEKYIRLAVKLMTKQLFLEYLRRYRAYRTQHRKDYAKDLRVLEKQYMADYKANQDFDRRVNNIVD